jgi:anti-sigma factor ChrR (cupin superfamily)
LEVAACVTVPVLNDVVHKIMCPHAKEWFDQPRAELVRWLEDHPDRVRELTAADEALRLIEAANQTSAAGPAALVEAQRLDRRRHAPARAQPPGHQR